MTSSSVGAYDILIFDLFGVVIAFDEDLVYRRIAEHCSDPTAAFTGMRGLVSNPDLIRGRRTLTQLHRELCHNYGLKLDLPSFETVWHVPYSEPMPGMADLLQSLSQRYKLLLLSNVDRYYWQVVKAHHPELRCFSKYLLSWELGQAKPERAAFTYAIQSADSSASKCFFIDDKAENIEAAEALGLRGHRFAGLEGLLEALRQNGIS